MAQIVRGAAIRSEVRDAVARTYGAVQLEIDTRRPRCDMSGRCCRFEEYGHRLYVSTIELAAFIQDLDDQKKRVKSGATGLSGFSLPQLPLMSNPGRCPFQTGKLCGVHSIRPFGCRMFFCDPTVTEWQHQTYERFHAELKALHEELNVRYFYVEWRTALAALGLME